MYPFNIPHALKKHLQRYMICIYGTSGDHNPTQTGNAPSMNIIYLLHASLKPKLF